MILSVKDIAKTLKDNKKQGLPVIIFTGAGCSKSAGMPLANELVAEINKKFKSNLRALTDTQKKDYGSCMGKLTPHEQKTLIEKHISKAKINWAHIALASLLKKGYIGKVLTFNFDNILNRACSLDNFFPPTYDLKVLSEEYFTAIPNQSIVHLHGQWSGFQLANSDADTSSQANKLKNYIKNTINTSPTLFIGYSGGADAFFKLVEENFIGQHRLFWVDYAKEPNNNVQKFIDANPNHRNFIAEQDADKFLLELAIELKCFPTALFKDPIKHLKVICEYVNNFPLNTFESDIDVLEDTKKTLAIADANKPIITTIKLGELLHAKKFESILNQVKNLDLSLKPISKIVASAHLGKALNFLTKDDDQFQISFDEAIKLEPNFYQAYIEVAFFALQFKTYKYDKKSCDFFEEAFKLKTNIKESEFFEGYAIALTRLAKHEDNEIIFHKALTKYQKAIAIDPNRAVLLGNYSSSLSSLASRKKDVDLFEQALDISKKSIDLKPDSDALLGNYADILASYGECISNENMIDESLLLYQKALKINPENLIIKGNYNVTITRLAATKRDEKLFYESIVLLKDHLMDDNNRDYNLACLYALYNDPINSKELLLKAEKLNALPSKSYQHLHKDTDLDNVRNEQWFIELMERLKPKEEQ